MSTQEAKPEAFNPLDILATAAALKQVDKVPTDQGHGENPGHTMAPSSSTQNQDTGTDANGDAKTSVGNNGNNGVHVRKIRVLKITSDIEKMLDEHNYGNSRKHFGNPSSWPETSVKDRKVIVTVVNRAGERPRVKSIDSVTVGPSGDFSVVRPSGHRKSENEGDQVNIDQVNCTEDTGSVLGVVSDSTAEGSETEPISLVSGDYSVSSEISFDSTESSSDSIPCTCTDKLECSCVNKNLQHGDTPSETTTTHKAGCSCDKTDSENATELEHQNCGGTDKQYDNKEAEQSSVPDTGVTHCDHDNTTASSGKASMVSPTTSHGTESTTISLGSSSEKSHIRVVSRTLPSPDMELGQPQTFVININHTKQTVHSDLVCPSKGDQSPVIGSLSQSQDLNVKPDGDCDDEQDCSSFSKNCEDQLLINSADDLSDSATPEQHVEHSVHQLACVNKEQVLDSKDGAGVAGRLGDNDFGKLSPEMGNVKVCSATASSQFVDSVDKHDNLDVSGHGGDILDTKLSDEDMFGCCDKSAFGDSTCSDSSNKIFLKTQTCLDSLKPLVNFRRSDETSSPATVDHCYAGVSDPLAEQKPTRKSMRLQSTESLVSDLSQDSGYVDVSPETPGGSKSFSPRLHESSPDHETEMGSSTESSPENVEMRNIKQFLVSSSSAGLRSQDLNDVNKTRDAIIALMQQSSSDGGNRLPVTPVKTSKITTPNKNVSPKVGKFRIGTFGSVSNSAMGLESPKKKKQPQVFTARQAPADLAGCSKSLIGKINGTGNSVFPCLITSTNNGQLSMNSTSSVESHNSWKSPVEHDHDYCLPPEAESSSPHLMAKLLKDTTLKTVLKCSGRDTRTESSDSNGSRGKRPRRVSLSSRPDLSHSGSTELSSPSSLSNSPVDFPVIQPHMTARQRAKAEKAAEYVKMGNSDSKLKITGKFQDDYIYFLNTKVRSRRRTCSQDLPPQIPPNRILIPIPKPGDIVVPHLTDADLEAIRLGKHASIKSAASSSGLGGLSVSASAAANLRLVQSSPSIMVTSNSIGEALKSGVAPTGPMSDEESKIINTILSMETGDGTGTASSSSLVGSDAAGEAPTLSLPAPDTFSFLPEQMNLTPEQYEILYSAMDEVQGFDDLDCGPSSPTSDLSEDTPTEPQGEPDTLTGPKDSPSPSTSLPVQEPPTNPSTDDTTQPSVDLSCPVSEPLKQDNAKSEDRLLTVQSLLQACRMAKSPVQEVGPVDGPGQEVADGVAGPATTVKSLLQADQSKSLLAPDIPVSTVDSSIQDLPFTSLEKSSLDLFGNDLKLFPEASVPDNSSPASIPPPVASSVPTPDYSAPWIVTVSMFWNDLPAIMINKLPYVRLVDIHKQILPAKDTGILKKRCQLLGIHVGNCTEMQRYFLVQYGKAFNSKSTLIVGKDNAKMLIGYYVNPLPKPARWEEAARNPDEHRAAPTKFSKVRVSGTKVKELLAEQRVPEVPPELPAPVVLPEDREVAVRPLPLRDILVARPSSRTAGSVSQTASPGRVSHRTRHKKINFLEMLKGDANNNTSVVDNSTSPGSVPEDEQCEGTSHDTSIVKEECVNKDKIARRKVHIKSAKITPAVKGKDKVVVTKVKVKKEKDPVPEELSMGESECENLEEEDEEEDEDMVEKEKLPFFIGKRGAKSNDREQMAKKLKIMKSRKPGALKVKWKIFGKSNVAKRGMFGKSNNKNDSRAEILGVVHKDMVPRNNGHKHRTQAGSVFLDQYNRKDSCCVRCCTCQKLLSVDMFLIHLHEIGGSGKLLSVSQPQVISLRDSYPSETQKRLWENFQKRRRLHSNHANNGDKTWSHHVDRAKVDKASEQILSVPSRKEEQKVTLRHCGSVPAIQTPTALNNGNVRLSARKRKQKQLYPIENYSFSRKAHLKTNLQIDSDGDEPLSPNADEMNVDGCSASKIIKLVPSMLGSDRVESVVPRPNQGSVLTLANGPEVISFTALQQDETMDMN